MVGKKIINLKIHLDKIYLSLIIKLWHYACDYMEVVGFNKDTVDWIVKYMCKIVSEVQHVGK